MKGNQSCPSNVFDIIYVGDCSNKSRRSYARLDALKKILPSSNFIEINWNPENIFFKFVFKIYLKFSLSFLAPWYLLLGSLLKKNTIIWVDNFPIFNETSIKFFKFLKPDLKIIFVSEDNFLLPHNSSKLHLPLLKNYNYIFTTKDFILRELGYMNNIFKFYDSFDHRFISASRDNNSNEIYHAKNFNITFIGTYEEERYKHISFLAENNFTVDIFGANWPETEIENINIHSPIYGDDYENIIKSSKINLIFLRKCNFDTVTSRSYEIPYFKNFFLAEYSDDHYELYKNTEILFRSSEELLSRVKFWLNKPDNFLDETAQTLYKNVAELDRSIFSETQNIITKIGI